MLTDVRTTSIINDLHDWQESIIREEHGRATFWFEKITSQVRRSGDVYLIDCYKLLAFRYYIFTNNLHQAQQIYHEMVVRKPNQTPDLNFLYHMVRGLYHLFIRDANSTGLKYLLHAKSLLPQCKNMRAVEKADFYFHVGQTSARLNDTKSSTPLIRKALHLYKKAQCLVRLSDCHIILGINYGRLENMRMSQHNYRQALLYVQESRRPELRMHTIYHNLGFNASKSGNHYTAITYYKKSLRLIGKAEFSARAHTMRNITEEFMRLNKTGEAKKWCVAGKEYAERHLLLAMMYHFEALNLELDDGRDIMLLKFLENEAVPFFEMKEHWGDVMDYLEIMIDCCQRVGHHEKQQRYIQYRTVLQSKYE